MLYAKLHTERAINRGVHVTDDLMLKAVHQFESTCTLFVRKTAKKGVKRAYGSYARSRKPL